MGYSDLPQSFIHEREGEEPVNFRIVAQWSDGRYRVLDIPSEQFFGHHSSPLPGEALVAMLNNLWRGKQ